MLVAVLHSIHDEDNPAGIIKTLLDALPPGSFLAASHLTGEHDRAAWGAIEGGYRAAGMPARWRDGDEFAELALTGLSEGKIKALVLNAGLQSPGPSQRTAEGFEVTFGVNHLSHYLLARLLLPVLAVGGPQDGAGVGAVHHVAALVVVVVVVTSRHEVDAVLVRTAA
jgi:NAD(P)-dependent dehydrogenase (short-subunit alcohol dehydrogenase family)